MPADNKTKSIIVEQRKRFSEACLWRMQREYFDREGINAWVNQVPFYITSNPYIAKCYAELAIGFINDTLQQNPEAAKNTFYIIELGTGSGRFSFYVLKTLLHQLALIGKEHIQICYIMSDFTKHNIQYYETHPALQTYLAAGQLDFAIVDLEVERPITLLKQNIRLNGDTLKNPLIVFANYIFDTIAHDAFTVYQQKLYELLLSVSSPDSNMKANKPQKMDDLQFEYHLQEIKGDYYQDAALNKLLTEYTGQLTQTSFLIPISSIRAINLLKKLAHGKLLIIASDKGYSYLKQLDNLGHPSLSFHGSFSMMVNFHALGEYMKFAGGDSYLPTPRRGIKTAVFVTDQTLNSLPHTLQAIKHYVEGFSPADYFTLHRRMSDSFEEANLETIAAHLNLTQWDPHIFLKLAARINTLLTESDNDTIEFLAKNMPNIAANYYFMPKSECVLFEIAVFYHSLKRFEHALQYYQQAAQYIGEQFGLSYNTALCLQHMEDRAAALAMFKKALSINPDSKEAQDWIAYLEKNNAASD